MQSILLKMLCLSTVLCSLEKSMHPYGHIQEKSDIRCSSFGCNAISLFTCLNLCCPSYYWSKWNTNIIQNMISNFPAVFTIFCGEATDCSYNQSDYGSSTQSPTATPMFQLHIFYSWIHYWWIAPAFASFMPQMMLYIRTMWPQLMNWDTFAWYLLFWL